MVLSILLLQIPALLIFSFHFVGAANRESSTATHRVPQCHNVSALQNLLIWYGQVKNRNPHVYVLNTVAESVHVLKKSFPSISTVHQRPVVVHPPSRRSRGRLPILHRCGSHLLRCLVPFIFSQGTDVIHQDHCMRETSFCPVRAVVPPHSLFSRKPHQSFGLPPLSQVRLVSLPLVHCATVHFSSCCAPAILRNRTQYGPGKACHQMDNAGTFSYERTETHTMSTPHEHSQECAHHIKNFSNPITHTKVHRHNQQHNFQWFSLSNLLSQKKSATSVR